MVEPDGGKSWGKLRVDSVLEENPVAADFTRLGEMRQRYHRVSVLFINFLVAMADSCLQFLVNTNRLSIHLLLASVLANSSIDRR
jgi:hypothetical protein